MKSKLFIRLVNVASEPVAKNLMRMCLMRIELGTGIIQRIGQMVQFQLKEITSILNLDGPWSSI